MMKIRKFEELENFQILEELAKNVSWWMKISKFLKNWKGFNFVLDIWKIWKKVLENKCFGRQKFENLKD